MRKILCIGIVLVFCSSLFAQDQGWKLKGMVGGTYSQTDVSDNWTGNDKDVVNWGFKLDAQGERITQNADWVTTLQEQYGKTRLAGNPEQISSDLIMLESVYNFISGGFLNPFVSARADTQNDNFLAPVTYTEAAGLGVVIIKNPVQNLKTRVGLAFKQELDTVHTRIDPVTLAVTSYSAADNPATPEIETSLYQTGVEWDTNYDLLVDKNIKFISEAQVFDGFYGGLGLRWDNSLFIGLGKYLTMQVGYLVIYQYDKYLKPVWPQDIQKRLTLILGVSYNIF